MAFKQNKLIFFCSIILFFFLAYIASKLTLDAFGGARATNFGGETKLFSRLIYAIFLTFLCSSKITFFAISLPISICAALYAPINYVYGLPDYQALVSLLATNINETFEFLTLIPGKIFLMAWSVPVLYLLIFFLARYFKIQPTKNKTYVLLSIVFMVILFEPSQIVRQTLSAGKITKEQLEQMRRYSGENSWGNSITLSKDTDYVLVIGEGARKDYFHRYGYPIKNTPFLDEVNSITVDGMKAGGTYTIGSLTNMLTAGELYAWKPRYNYSFLDLANSAGIKTYWLSNQGFVGEFDTPVSAIGNKAQHVIFTHRGSFVDKNMSDFQLLEPFKKILDEKAEGSRLIVLHTMGSHPDVCRRILDVKDPYKVKGRKLDYIACYVTSIKKTDAFIEKIYNLLTKEKDRTGRPFSIIYFSDHGQVHEDKSGVLKIHNNSLSKFHYDIPLIRIDSDFTERKFFTSQKSGLKFTEGLADWMKIQNPNLKGYDLFDGKNDPEDFGLKQKIDAIKTPADPAVDITPYLKK